MSNWRIKGYVQDSDEEEDLDLGDAYAPKPLEVCTADVGRPETTTAPQSSHHQAVDDTIANPPGSRDELALESSQNALVNRTKSSSDASHANPSSAVEAIATRAGILSHCDSTNDKYGAPISSIEIPYGDHPHSEAPTTGSANALSRKSLATQLFSEEQMTSTPGRGRQSRSSRPATPTLQDDDLNELQRDWPLGLNGTSSTASSPLSDARSDIEPPDWMQSSPPMVTAPREPPQDITGTGRQLVEVGIPPCRGSQLDQAAFDQLDDAEKTRIRRALRKRNPIQLHPYLLEAEKYRQNLKARGLKPVNIGVEHHRHHEKQHERLPEKQNGNTDDNSQNLDSQDREFVMDDTQSSDVRQSSPGDLPSSPPRGVQGTLLLARPNSQPGVSSGGVDVDDEDFEFPDLSVLLQRKHHGSVQQGFKRRKTLHTFSRKGALNRTSSLPQSPHAIPPNRLEQDRGVLEIPPSPPASETPPINDQLPQKPHVPPRLRLLSPTRILQPPTPAMSSTRRQPQTMVINSDSDDEPPISTARHRGFQRTNSHAALSGSSSGSGEDEDQELQHVKKRIKGVLPASWLRLDKQAQANKKPKANHAHRRRASNASTEMGRATPTWPSRRASPVLAMGTGDQQGPMGINDDLAGSDTDSNSTIAPRARQNLSLELGFADSFDNLENFEVQEHDWVDPMLPSGSRQIGSKKTRRKRQLKMTDSVRGTTKRPRLDSFDRPDRTDFARSRESHQKSSAKERRQSRHQPRLKPPNLSILDAPVLNNSESAQIPQFLRIAARQVRRQPNKGRHSPANKHIRLQNEADTEDAHSTLRAWRAGKVRPSTRYEHDIPDTRLPLSDLVANQQGMLHQQQLPRPQKLGGERAQRMEHVADSKAPLKQNRQPRMHQIKLNPVVVSRNTSTTPSSRSRRPNLAVSIARRPTMQKPKAKQPEYRTAQLERPENDYDSRNRAAAFQKKLNQLDRMYATATQLQFQDAWTGKSRTPKLARFLEDEDQVAPLPIPELSPDKVVASVETDPPQPAPKPKRKTKAKVQRIDVDTREYRQPSEPLPPVREDSSLPSVQSVEVEAPRLEGLGGFGTRYSTDFDIAPLWTGTFFHESTFIGSGEFQQSLLFDRRDLDMPCGLSSFTHDGTFFRWGAWTEDVASEMTLLLSSIASRVETAQSTSQGAGSEDTVAIALVDFLCVLRNVVRYLATHVHFLDPVDRRSFVARMHSLLNSATSNVLADLAYLPQDVFSGNSTGRTRFRLPIMLLLLVHQVSRIAEHPQVDTSMKKNLDLLFKALVKSVLQLILRKGMGEIRKYIDENRRHTAREQGIREDRLAIESLVIIYHLLGTHKSSQWCFWGLVKEEWGPSLSRINHVQSFERLWYDTFALLPYLEIDAGGLIKASHRFQSVQGDWSVVVPLLNRVFALYPETAKTNEVSVNVYLRACLTRCYNLIHSWGWKKCDILLTSVFDFFSRRGFKHLQNEESKGSPRFLEDLHEHPNLNIQPDDRAFHVFLKTLATGFGGLRNSCTARQIQNIAWRLVPNHRRTYHKEEALRQEDLDGLRNQHDLLCTLYWASPPGFRPRLTSLRNLVDQTRSHREVCRLSVRAWSNLARYQISTDEGMQGLEPFADWFKEIISQNLTQYKLARSEAEGQYETARSLGHEGISAEHLQLTIKNNQAQILATLTDAVYGMKATINTANDADCATSLLRDSAITDIFKVFDAKNPQTSKLIVDVLQIFQTYLELLQRKKPQLEIQETSEDSQDYGGSFSLEDVEQIAPSDTNGSDPSIDFINDAVWHLVSSCFGAESSPDDTLLVAVVETWSMIARRLVQKGLRGWSNFLDSYNANSWRQLQDTEQTRKYSALFMSTVLAQDPSSYDDNKDNMLWSWFVSLVERESMLKFQHRLTTSLINRDPDHPLFRNLPFLKDSKTTCVDVKLPEFRQRRLNLISSVLANMRDDYESAMQSSNRDLPGLRREYSGLLKHFMATMKKNYQDLGQNSGLKSAYVEFVQNVVEFLQQHTHDICPVDPFFTDSSAFPLPATDPTYVIGRLKSYVPRLMEQRTLKQLVSFIQNVSERAAVDNEQGYLASQLKTATLGAFESGDARRPTLRQVFLGAIFPAYIDQTFATTAGWIFVKPLLQASRSILQELNYQGCQYSISDTESVAIVDSLLSTMLDAMYSATELLITHSGLLEQPHVLHILSLVFAAVAATVLPAAHIYRRTGLATAAVQRIDAFEAFSLFVAAQITAPEAAHDFSPYPQNDPRPLSEAQTRRFAEVRQLCAKDLGQVLGSGSWVKQGEQCFLVRKNGRRLVQTAVGSFEEESQRVVRAIEEFHGVLRTALWRGEEDLRERRRNGKKGKWPTSEGEMVVI